MKKTDDDIYACPNNDPHNIGKKNLDTVYH